MTEWKQLAIYLLPAESADAEIEIISKNNPKDLKGCKIDLYTQFLQQGVCTWKTVIEALEKSNHPNIMQRIKEDFMKLKKST